MFVGYPYSICPRVFQSTQGQYYTVAKINLLLFVKPFLKDFLTY